jgi:hypothetical protein
LPFGEAPAVFVLRSRYLKGNAIPAQRRLAQNRLALPEWEITYSDWYYSVNVEILCCGLYWVFEIREIEKGQI